MLSWKWHVFVSVKHTDASAGAAPFDAQHNSLPCLIKGEMVAAPSKLQSACKVMSPTCPQLHARHECTYI